MAFVSMLFAYFVIICAIIGFFYITGIILFLVGTAVRKNPKNKGKKWPMVIKIIGIINISLASIPVILVVGSITINKVSLAIQRSGYERALDKWQYEQTDAWGASDDVRAAFVEAIEEDNPEIFKEYFTEEVRNKEDFDERIDELFDECPEDIIVHLFGDDNNSDKSTEKEKYGTGEFSCEASGEDYFIEFGFCNYSEDNPQNLGITYFRFEDEETHWEYVVYGEHCITSVLGLEDCVESSLTEKWVYFPS